MLSGLTTQVRQDHLEVAAEFPKYLPAGAAWRRGLRRGGDDRHPAELAMSLRDCLEHRDARGADGQPVGRVLDIAAGDDQAARGLEGGADLEAGERRVRVAARRARRGDQLPGWKPAR